MTELLIFDRHDNLITIFSNNGELACPFWDAPFKEILNGGSTFEFKVPADHEDARHVIAENQVAFLDKDNQFRLFVIKEPEKINGENGAIIHALCEPAMYELIDDIIKDVRPQNATIQFALQRALNGTRWQIGATADFGLATTNFYYINVIQAINNIVENWGGEIRDRIEINGNKIVGRYIDILSRRGADTGKLWEIDKDILNIAHKVQSYPKTALYGRGSSLEIEDTGGYTRKISFADVEWSVANGDPVDKPLGQEWVGDSSALNMYGRKNSNGTLRHRFGIFESNEQKEPLALLQETWNALQKQKHPVENYSMDVFLLEEITGHEHEKVRLGDTTIAIDRSFAEPIEVEERVVAYEYDVSDPDNTGHVELGQYIDVFNDEDRLDRIETKLNDRSGIWDSVQDPIIVNDETIENITPPKVTGVVASGAVKTIMLEWDFVNAIYLANYEVYASQVKGFAPDSSNLIFRGKTSGYAHKANTDEVWYFRVRAVNTHGVAGSYSDETTANSLRIISDDILFGEDIAAELRELSNTAEILSEQAKDNIRQKAIDQAATYAQNKANAAQLEAIRQSSLDAQNKVNAAKTALESDIAKKVDATWVDGKLVSKADKSDTYTKSETDNALNSKVSNAAYTVDQQGIVNRFNQAESRLTQTEQGLLSTVSKTDFEQLQIGGRNLLKETNVIKPLSGSFDISAQTVIENGETFRKSTLNAVDGYHSQRASYYGLTSFEYPSTYTISADIRATKGSNFRFGGRNYALEGNNELFYTYFDGTGRWERVSCVFTFKKEYNDVLIVWGGQVAKVGDTIEIKNLKYEKGNRATDYTLAPEDIDGQINGIANRMTNAETTINQTASDVSLKANKTDVYTKTETDGKIKTVDNRLKTAEASLIVQANEISQRVTKTEFDNLQIGGRNLLANSTFNEGFRDWSSLLNSISTVISPELDKPKSNIIHFNYAPGTSNLLRGNNKRVLTKSDGTESMTVSFDIFIENNIINHDNNSTIVTLRRYNEASGGSSISTLLTVRMDEIMNAGAVSGEWFRYTTTFNLDSHSAKWILFCLYQHISGGNFKLREIKWEFGNRATDWSPSTDDVEGRLATTESTITQHAGLINSKASSNEVSGLSGRLITAEQNINGLTGEISNKVSQIDYTGNKVASLMNQTATTIKLQANKVEMGNGDLVVENNIVKVKAAAIGTVAIADGAITRSKIGNAVIGTAQIENASITNTLIAANADIDGAKIANATIVDAKISNLNGTKIIAYSIDVDKLKAGMLTGFTIQTDANQSNPRIVMTKDRMTISNTIARIELNTSGSYGGPEFTFYRAGASTPVGHMLSNSDDLLITQAGRQYNGKLALFGNKGVEFRNALILYKGYGNEPYLPTDVGTMYYDTIDNALRIRTITGWKNVQVSNI